MKRHYAQLLYQLLEEFPCVAILGVRQCGKTTLLKELPKTWKIFDLEKGSDYSLAARDPDLFLRLNSSQVALDECQRLPELFSALRVAIDAERNKAGRFIITGSSSPQLVRSISESLAGRIAIIEMSPFSISEAYSIKPSLFFSYLVNNNPLKDFLTLTPRINQAKIHDYWYKGGYPEPWIKDKKRFTKLWMQNYIQTYIDRDIRNLFPGLNQHKYRLFLSMLSHLSGSIINYSDVARVLGVSQPTVRDYFNIAHRTFIWRHFPPYEKNATKRIIKHPKGYLRDTGILHSLMHLVDRDGILSHPNYGRSWEAMVIENILRGLHVYAADFQYFYYRTGGGAEIDLILEGEFGLIPVEIKYGQKIMNKSLRPIKDFIRDYKCKFGIVVHNVEFPILYDDNIIGIPVSCL